MALPRSSEILLIALSLACAQEPVVEPPPAFDAEIEDFVRAKMIEGGLPGVAASIIKHDEVVWVGTYGTANFEERISVDRDSLFIVASVSKTIVATALMQLVEDGKLNLDAPVDDYLGFSLRHPDHPDDPITTRMLMTHTSGVLDNFLTLLTVSTVGDASMPLPEFAESYATESGTLFQSNHFGGAPGTKRKYCNACFGILGAIIEKVSGTSFPEHCRARIFDPLGMSSTGWLLSEVNSEHLTVPYSGTFEEGFAALDHPGYGHYPATSLRTSITDYSKFLSAFMKNGEGIVTPESVAEMRRRQVPDQDKRQALTWSYRKRSGEEFLGHSGSTTGGAAITGYRERDRVGITILTNSDAYIRSLIGLTEGEEAMDAIHEKLNSFADEL